MVNHDSRWSVGAFPAETIDANPDLVSSIPYLPHHVTPTTGSVDEWRGRFECKAFAAGASVCMVGPGSWKPRRYYFYHNDNGDNESDGLVSLGASVGNTTFD